MHFSEETERLIAQEHDRIGRHAQDCFAPYKCQSCGCDKRGVYWSTVPAACVSHSGNAGHMAALKQRELDLLERSVLAQEALAAK